jgi:hypothetical protein
VTNAFVENGTNQLPYLGIMQDYPSVAYRIAAVVPKVTGLPTLSAIWITAILAIYASYTAIIAAFVRNGRIVAAILFTAVSLATTTTRAESGYEIIGNFAYPQLISTAFYFWLLYFLSTREKLSTITNSIVVLAVAALTLSTHGLAALETLATFGTAVLAQFALTYVWERKIDRAALIVLAAYFSLGVVLLSVHPGFAFMRKVSVNDGVIALEISEGALLVAGLISSAVLGWRVWVDNDANRLKLVVFSAVFAATILMLLQFLALNLFHQGSPYAVKKHCWFIFTTSLMAISLIVSDLAPRGIDGSLKALRLPHLIAAVLAFICSFVVMSRPGIDIATINRQIMSAKTALRNHPNFRPGNTVALAGDVNNVIRYMISTAVFQMKLDDQPIFHLITADFDPKSVPYAMVNRSPEIEESCPDRHAEAGSFVIVPTSCIPN